MEPYLKARNEVTMQDIEEVKTACQTFGSQTFTVDELIKKTYCTGDAWILLNTLDILAEQSVIARRDKGDTFGQHRQYVNLLRTAHHSAHL